MKQQLNLITRNGNLYTKALIPDLVLPQTVIMFLETEKVLVTIDGEEMSKESFKTKFGW